MTAPKYETIEATARESALYQAGEAIGAAKATEAAAVALTEMQSRLRAEPDDVSVWLAAAAAEVEALAAQGPKAPGFKGRVAALAAGLQQLGPTLLERRRLHDGWFAECVGNLQQVAGKHREAFAQQLASIPEAQGPLHTRKRLAVWLQGAAALVGGKRA